MRHVDLERLEAGARAPLGGRREVGLTMHVPEPRLWSVDAPQLYDLTACLRCGDEIVDCVNSYAGLREFLVRDREVLLNGESFYVRGVLDQGYFPGGWYTAPADADLKRDIDLMKSMGFNCVRKHQKAEDPRWLAWADRLGLVVWGEMGNGREFGSVHVDDFTREWAQIVRRDRMHPCVMTWVPFNESWGVDRVANSVRQQAWVRAVYHLTRTLDGTRPVLANDGWQFFVGDIWGIHNYVPDGPFLQQILAALLAEPSRELVPGRCAALPGADVTHVPVMLTEFGGVAFSSGGAPAKGWGYDVVKDAAGLEQRARELVRAVRAQAEFGGFVWTQLTDVQQEINGLLHFDRTPKLPLATYRSIFGD